LHSSQTKELPAKNHKKSDSDSSGSSEDDDHLRDDIEGKNASLFNESKSSHAAQSTLNSSRSSGSGDSGVMPAFFRSKKKRVNTDDQVSVFQSLISKFSKMLN
jgi:hypothetical protein